MPSSRQRCNGLQQQPDRAGGWSPPPASPSTIPEAISRLLFQVRITFSTATPASSGFLFPFVSTVPIGIAIDVAIAADVDHEHHQARRRRRCSQGRDRVGAGANAAASEQREQQRIG